MAISPGISRWKKGNFSQMVNLSPMRFHRVPTTYQSPLQNETKDQTVMSQRWMETRFDQYCLDRRSLCLPGVQVVRREKENHQSSKHTLIRGEVKAWRKIEIDGGTVYSGVTRKGPLRGHIKVGT